MELELKSLTVNGKTYTVKSLEGGYDQGYQDGYSDGQASMVDESKIIEKTVTGTRMVSVDDVSEIPHEVTVQLSGGGLTDYSGVTVKRVGKNLIPYPFAYTTHTHNGITFTDNGDGSITINGTATAAAYFILQSNCDFVDGPINAITAPNGATNGDYAASYRLYYNDGTNVLSINILSGVTVDNETIYPQLERGSIATAWEPYTAEKYTPTADGLVRGIPSLSPIMNIIADADVDISLSYHKSYGMQTEYDRLWDVYQDRGNRTNYQRGFYQYWTDATFKPKYDMRPTTAYDMFNLTGITDLRARLRECGVTLDFSDCKDFAYTFSNSALTHVGVIDLRKSSGLNLTFHYAQKLKVIEKLIFTDDGLQNVATAFMVCFELTEIRVEGVIGQNGLNLQWSSKLSADSIVSIVSALSTTTTGLTVTLSLEAVNNAFEASEGAADGSTSEEWLALIATRENWTIALS